MVDASTTSKRSNQIMNAVKNDNENKKDNVMYITENDLNKKLCKMHGLVGQKVSKKHSQDQKSGEHIAKLYITDSFGIYNVGSGYPIKLRHIDILNILVYNYIMFLNILEMYLFLIYPEYMVLHMIPHYSEHLWDILVMMLRK